MEDALPNKALEPYDHGVTTDLVVRLSGPVGVVMLNWPFIEQSMAQITEATADAVRAAGIIVKRYRQFADRLKYLRRIFESVPTLQKHAKFFEHITAGLDQLTPVRHALAHGRISYFDVTTSMVTFTKINPDRAGSHHTLELIRLSIELIDSAGSVSVLVARDLGRLARALVDEFVVD